MTPPNGGDGITGNQIIPNTPGYVGGQIVALTTVTLTFTFVGYEASWLDNFYVGGVQVFQNKTTAVGATYEVTVGPGAIDFAGTSLGQKLQKNSVQRSKIEAKLLAAGYTGTVYEAAYGFKNFGQLNAATNMVQNQGTSFELLKVLMTGEIYRASRLPDGTVKLVSPDLATNPVSTLSLGQAKQAIAGGAELPVIVPVTTTTTATN